MYVHKLINLAGLTLMCLACHQPEVKQPVVETELNESEGQQYAKTDEMKSAAKQWILEHYDFADHSYDNPLYSDRYKAYLRAGNDAVMGEGATEESYHVFVKKYSAHYTINNGQYDRGGFDPPIVKIISCDWKSAVRDTNYFEVKVQSMGVDSLHLKAENEFYNVSLRLVSDGKTFKIDEILYHE